MCSAGIPVISTEEDKTRKRIEGIMITGNALKQYVIEAGDLWCFEKSFCHILEQTIFSMVFCLSHL